MGDGRTARQGRCWRGLVLVTLSSVLEKFYVDLLHALADAQPAAGRVP